MPTINSNDYQLMFSLKSQAVIEMALADESINKCRSTKNFAPFTLAPVNIADRAWHGKGHPFSTFVTRIGNQYTLPSQERACTSLELLFASAYCLGSVVSTIPNSASPTVYLHTITFLNTTTTKEPRYTSMVQMLGSESVKKYSGVWINSMKLSGNRMDHVGLSFEGGARNEVSTAISSPLSITSAAFFQTLYGTMSFGAYGAEADISVEVLSWELGFSQNCQPLFLMGNSSGDELLLSEVLIGKQTVSGQFVVKYSATHRTKFTANTKCGLIMTLKSPTVIGATATVHQCVITIPELYILSEAKGLEGDTITLTLGFGDEGIVKTGSGAVATLAITSDQGTSELLING